MIIVETGALPSPIREKFRTAKVSMRDCDDGGVVLSPLCAINELRGVAKGSEFTTERLFESRREEKAFEEVRL